MDNPSVKTNKKPHPITSPSQKGQCEDQQRGKLIAVYTSTGDPDSVTNKPSVLNNQKKYASG